jgi:hypothetical protein
MTHEFTGWLRLKDDLNVRVKLCVFEDPKHPTPNEPEIARVPTMNEYPQILAKMARMDFDRIETQTARPET